MPKTPSNQQQPGPPVSADTGAAEANPLARHILVVEDSKIVASFIKDSLELGGEFQVRLAHSLAETETALHNSADTIFAAILDLNLPDAPSGEVVDLVLRFDLPVIVLTSFIDQDIRQRIEAKGVVDYVLKSRDAVRQVHDILLRLEKNKGVKILVADDSQVQRSVTGEFLQRFGFDVLEAADGQQALDTLHQHGDVPLVITDYEMPNMNGFELCKQIRETWDRNQLAVIGVSSRDNELLSARLLKAGANDFLSKPFQREELYTRIIHNLETQEHIARINSSLATISSMHERMKKDLDAAARLQQSLLPKELPSPPAVQAARLFSPCDELAGDTFNMFLIDERHLGVYVVDVSGHGVPAALLSVTLSRLLTPEEGRTSFLYDIDENTGQRRIHSPASVCENLNTEFPMDPDTFQYFTIVYGILDIQEGDFSFACAGHPGPVLVRNNQQPQAFATRNMAIGFVPGLNFQQDSVTLQSGDRLYFFTDGLVEAKNQADEEYGLDRLCMTLQKHYVSGLEDSLQNVYNAVKNWNAEGFKDDVTICALEYS